MTDTNASALHLYELGQPKNADSWLISDWGAGQTSNMNWSDDHVQVAADGSVELLLGRAVEGASRPYEGGEIQSNEVATTGTWSWTAKAPEMEPGAVFGMFTYKADWKNQPWVEFDFEFVGADTTKVQLAIHMEDVNGRHITLTPEATERSIIDLGFDAAKGYHTYEVSVTEKDATFFIDGQAVATFSGADMPGGVWQIGPMKSFVDLWSVSSGQEAWAGKWVDPGHDLVASVQTADIRAGEFGSAYVPVIEEPVVEEPTSPVDDDGDDLLVVGTAGDDTLDGGAGDDALDGQSGADVLSGGLGNDTYWVDDAGDVVIESADGGIDTVHATVNTVLSENVENLQVHGIASGHVNGTGNARDNTISGSDGKNILSGLEGADRLEGRGGNDVLIGGRGDDVLVGGGGKDRFVFAAGDGVDVIEDFNARNGEILDLKGVAGEWSLRIEDAGLRVVLGEGDSVLLKGVDVADVSVQNFRINGAVPQELAAAVADSTSSDSGDWTNDSIDMNASGLVIGGEQADVLFGTAGSNTLHGLDGADRLNGKAGADALYGGRGNDTYFVDNVGDQTFEYAKEGHDTVHASVDWTLSAHTEDLTLRGSKDVSGTGNGLDNVIKGNTGANTLEGLSGADVLIGNGGDDALYGGVGADVLVGGLGADTLWGGQDQDQDVFVLRDAAQTPVGASDEVHDFVSGVDVFDFREMDANTTLQNDQGFAYAGSVATANALWTGQDGTDTLVWGDVDGDAVADFEVRVVDTSQLAASDFLL